MKEKEFEKAKVFNLENSIGYAEDAIISKAILKKAEGTITLFSFDEGQGLSEHTAPFDAQVHIIDGTARVYIDKKPFDLAKDDIIVLPANIPHAL